MTAIELPRAGARPALHLDLEPREVAMGAAATLTIDATDVPPATRCVVLVSERNGVRYQWPMLVTVDER